jgi:WD40 repeat protein
LPRNVKELAAVQPSPDGTLVFWSESGALPPKLVAADTGKVLATLEALRDVTAIRGAFSPDGARLVVSSGNHTMHLWDLRELRRELAELGLDWDLPPYPPQTPRPGRPIRVEVKPAAPVP